MDIITLGDLTKAIANKIGVDMEKARRDAELVMDIFGFQDRVIDNTINPKDRQIFYMLEKEGMLTTQREEILLHDGRQWRIHYWIIQKDAILRYAQDDYKKTQTTLSANQAINAIYDNLSDGIWATRNMNK